MRYDNYKKGIFSNSDLERVKLKIQKDIDKQQKDLLEFITDGENRIREVESMDRDKKYTCLGRTYKDGRDKDILLIIRYQDGTQRDVRYSFKAISDMRKKLSELKENHSDVDWTEFEEEI